MIKYIANVVLNDFTNDSRVSKISKTLGQAGHKVTVVAVYNEGLDEDSVAGGINVFRVRLRSRSWSKAKPVQLLKYLEFCLRCAWRYRNYDVVHCNDLGALPIGVAVKLLWGKAKVVYDCHEYETEIDSLGFLEKKLRKLVERSLIGLSDAVITVSDSIAKEYQRLYNIDKPALVLNCPVYYDPPRASVFRKDFGIRDDQRIFLYQGGLKTGRGIELLVESFSGLQGDDNVLVVMGYGALQGLVKESAEVSKTIFYQPAVEPDVLLDYTCGADYGILFYEDTCLNHRYCSPNKIFEYLMAGLPVLTSDLVEMRRLVEDEGVGIVAKDNSVEGFRDAVRSSLNQDYRLVYENVLRARRKYCWEEQEKVLLELYEKL